MAERDEIDVWMETVRDPADEASEGERTIDVRKGLATAAYEVAPLPDGRWAVRLRCQHQASELGALALPWRAFPTREECLAFFVQTAREFFAREERARVSEAQRRAREEMAALLAGGLYGFEEPVPVKRK